MKKTEVITFRTSAEVKQNLQKMAEDKEWSIAQAVDKICREYFKEKTSGNEPEI